jgi:hypothetical protein
MSDQPSPHGPWKHAGRTPDGVDIYIAAVDVPPPSRIEWPPEIAPTYVQLHTEPPPPPPEPTPGYARATYHVPWETEPDVTYRFVFKSGATHLESAVSRETDRYDTDDALEDLIDVPPITEPQAQGDVFVVPWPPTTAPAMRAEREAAAALIPSEGCPIEPTRSHILLPVDLPADGHGPRPRYIQLDKGNTLGVLVVEPGSAARLSHPQHPDLLIGPGVYALHAQRRWTHRGAPARVAD